MRSLRRHKGMPFVVSVLKAPLSWYKLCCIACILQSKTLYSRAAQEYRASKKSSLLVIGLESMGPLQILNGTKLVVNDQRGHSDSLRINLESFRTIRSPLFHKPVTFFGSTVFLSGSSKSKFMWRLSGDKQCGPCIKKPRRRYKSWLLCETRPKYCNLRQ